MSRVFQTITGATILLGLLSIFSLRLSISSAMPMNEMGQMTNCALAQTATLCPASVAQHLQFWQQVFVTTSPTVILLALMFVIAMFPLKRVIDPLHAAAAGLRYGVRQLLSAPALLLGDYVRQAFSQGILHPKIY